MTSSDHPTRQELEQLVERLGPAILQLCQSRGISEAKAAKLVEEALVTLSHRWNRVGDRERWLLKTLDEETAQRKEPKDE